MQLAVATQGNPDHKEEINALGEHSYRTPLSEVSVLGDVLAGST